MTINRRNFLVRGASAIAAGSLLGNELLEQATSKTPDAETLYIDVSGTDTNAGTKDKPIKSLAEAARRVSASKGNSATTVLLGEGIHALDQSALFKPERQYSKSERLTIRAASLPDDPDWSPQRMPVLIHTMPLSLNGSGGRPDPFGGFAYGMQFETSHVTVQGLKILGAPYLEQPTAGVIRRVYPIAREGELDDLEIKQCMFLGNREVAENHCAILARGNGVVVDHCVFYGCKVTIVYWSQNARGCAMRNTLACNNYVTGAYICAIGEDFEFQNNVMSGNLSGILFQGQVKKYNLANSLFAGNQHLYGSGFGPPVNFKPLESSVLALPASSNVTQKPVQIELDQTKRNCLHVAEGTPGSDLGAGLFTKKS
jgi:hypothetical protein